MNFFNKLFSQLNQTTPVIISETELNSDVFQDTVEQCMASKESSHLAFKV
jgi:hypothetical protein